MFKLYFGMPAEGKDYLDCLDIDSAHVGTISAIIVLPTDSTPLDVLETFKDNLNEDIYLIDENGQLANVFSKYSNLYSYTVDLQNGCVTINLGKLSMIVTGLSDEGQEKDVVEMLNGNTEVKATIDDMQEAINFLLMGGE